MINPEATLTNGASFHQASVSSSSVVVNIYGDLVKRYLPVVDKRAVDVCTDNAKKSFIDASYTEGKALASIASAYISANGSNSLHRLLWFYAYKRASNSRKPTDWTAGIDMVFVALVLSSMRPYLFRIFSSVTSFNEVPQTDLCGGSFTTVRSHNVRGGTVLHELTRLISDTLDVIYGCTNDQNLLAAEQVVNADNYNACPTPYICNSI
ncbi:hypothetical protein EV421DRAFT_1906489 [Armillaria borealis]|uniref:Uncharacterized protein n=1 Tax=Armillaria borealis TaxID=47425 RepID=A0AA39MKU8_9AGAR|nr:hypothetical protein EV421DRAFT_1906489 [Armillaria borealis]